MISTRRGLIVVWACAGVLAAALWLDVRRTPPVVERDIAPFIEALTTKAIAWEGGPIPIRIERDVQSSTGWKWIDPAGDAERQTVEDLIATLRGARWHRRDRASAAGTPTKRVTIEYEVPGNSRPTTLSISIGDALPAGEQQWIVVDSPYVSSDRPALLVDSWVVRALVPDPVALRIRRPFAGVATAREIEMGSFVLRGTPRRIVKLAGMPIELYANAAVVDDFERALAEITTLAIPRGKVPVDTNFRGTRIALSGKLVAVEAGRCPAPNREMHAIIGPAIGPACVDDRQWEKLLATAALFDLRDDATTRQRMLAALVEPRPVPMEPTTITLGDGARLSLAKRPSIADKGGSGRDADPARIAELLAVLQTPGKPVPLPTTPPVATIEVQGPRSDQPEITIALYAGGVIAHKNEPIALELGAAAYDILARGGRAYVDPALWTEEPTTIASVKIGDVTYTRGAVVGEWTREPAGAFDPASVEKLVVALATARSLGPATATIGGRTIVLAIKPPVGDPRTRTLGIAGGKTCVAVVDATTHAIQPQICALVDGLAR